ncbi:hypothetical protein GJ654_06435 [Rhodoblastus acidophilus]|uniref:CobQ/CobB/MinD/ParA nucleotide binding domain-containing protein n=1 Tax=Rhodoblastus acidophilus TaxID=1074 RepID=A0A6N8DJL0_RHOAC|nr:hypothetical protein [Rhodoblastus acidophilus]MCW2274056.1 hypothetical protein [Rhodoblastus acidophilus]MTV30629.1 hypothetical protein [Rhodoblastus acidophilus]
MKPAVILVGADKGGVGKTTVSRALLDYLAANTILTRAFDTESPRGTLKRFHGPVTEVVDIAETSDQMRILDTLNSAQIKVSVIDTRAGALGATLRALRDVGFLDAVKAGEFSFTLMHVLGPSIASLDEIAETAPFIDSAHYFLVKNHINATTFFEWDPVTNRKYFEKVNPSGEIIIPKLDEMACEQVEIAGTSFSTFVANKTASGEPANASFVLRGYVRTWQARIAEELNRVRLLDLLAQR